MYHHIINLQSFLTQSKKSQLQKPRVGKSTEKRLAAATEDGTAASVLKLDNGNCQKSVNILKVAKSHSLKA